jgi:vacuolar protein sorting-associated protein 13A/C
VVQVEPQSNSCRLLGIQSPVAVAGLLSGKGENNHTQEDVPESADTDQTKLAKQENIFLTGVLDELKIVISNSRDIDHKSPKLLLVPESPLLELRAIGTKVITFNAFQFNRLTLTF